MSWTIVQTLFVEDFRLMKYSTAYTPNRQLENNVKCTPFFVFTDSGLIPSHLRPPPPSQARHSSNTRKSNSSDACPVIIIFKLIYRRASPPIALYHSYLCLSGQHRIITTCNVVEIKVALGQVHNLKCKTIITYDMSLPPCNEVSSRCHEDCTVYSKLLYKR